MSITITLSLPHKALSPNARVHWRTKAKAAKLYRRTAWALAYQLTEPKWDRASVTLAFYHGTKRRRDRDNLIASVKPAFDGLQDAGVVKDDSGIESIDVHQHLDKANPRLEITVTPL